jgi:hypothetical protein
MKEDKQYRLISLGICAGCIILRALSHHPGPTWDEAMNMLSTESILQGTDNAYSYWFWRHPPLFKSLIALGYARPYPAWNENLHLIMAALSGINAFILMRVLTRTHGKIVALASGFAWLCLPGPRFYDLWIKGDLLVITFGLLALGAAANKKIFQSGLLLGLAMLTKETAAIWTIPLAFYLPRKPHFRAFWVCYGTAIALCLPWYAFRIPELTHYLAFATGLPLTETEDWSAPWYTYWIQLPKLLGYAGVLIVISGLVIRKDQLKHLWPLTMLFSGLVLLSLIRGKPPWLFITFQPALAALCGIGLARVLDWARRHPFHPMKLVSISSAVIALSLQAFLYDSDALLKSLSPSTHWGTHSSQEAAALINENVPATDSFSVSPMYYWYGKEKFICPILLCSLSRPPDILIRPGPMTRNDYLRILKGEEPDWALVSPNPQQAETELFPLIIEGHVRVIPGQGALLVTGRPTDDFDVNPTPGLPINAHE